MILTAPFNEDWGGKRVVAVTRWSASVSAAKHVAPLST